MGRLLYSHPDDNLAAQLTPAIQSGAAASGYGVDKLTNQNPAYPFIATTTVLRLTWGPFGSPVLPAFCALFHTNIDGVASIQGNSSSDFSSPEWSAAFTIPGLDEDGYRDNPWLNLSSGYAAKTYLSLIVASNTQNIRIGEIWLGSTIRRPHQGHERGSERVERHRAVAFETSAGVEVVTDLGTRDGTIANLAYTTNGTGLATLRSWRRAAQGRTRPFAVVFDDAVNHAQFVRFDDERYAVVGLSPDLVAVRIGLREVSRGLAY